MAIFAYDHNMLAAPELLVPGEKPVGPVEVNRNNIIGSHLKHWWPFQPNISHPHEIDSYWAYGIFKAGGDFMRVMPLHSYYADFRDQPDFTTRNGKWCAKFVAANGDRLFRSQQNLSADNYPFTGDVTYGLMVEFNSTSGDIGLISRYSSGQSPHTKYGDGMLIEGGTLYGFRSNGTSYSISATPPATGKKSFLVFTISGTTGYLYIDGVQQSSGTMNSTSYTGTYSFALGESGYSSLDFLDGYVFGAWILKRHLSAGQVMDWYLDPYQFLKAI
jgi:hypothetical protein